MSGFWSSWVIFLAVLTIGISVALFIGGMRVKLPTQDDGTTGHDWDGIREGVRNLPWWWIVYSAVGFLVALGYFVLMSTIALALHGKSAVALTDCHIRVGRMDPKTSWVPSGIGVSTAWLRVTSRIDPPGRKVSAPPSNPASA